MKKMKYLVFMLMAVLLLAACGKSEEVVEGDTAESVEAEETTEEENVQEPVKLFGVFDTQTLDGEPVTEEIWGEADLTMVNIWGTFCGPCIAEMPDLGEISREYEDKGFQIVGMLCDVMEADDETALEIVDKTKADYTHLIASDDLVKNALQYVSSVPTTAFVDKEGNLVGEIYSGARDKETWEQIINEYLEEVQ
jgi:thiol-disulfide isomerase/thioredoxin